VNAVVMSLIVGTIVFFWPREKQLEQWVSEQYPVEAVNYLESHPPSGHLLNGYLWGGYLNWRDPSVKVFVDSRVDIFEYSGVLKDYLELLELKQPKTTLEKYEIQYVLFPRTEALTYVLEHDPAWKVLYSDQISILLERVDPK
jgi:hypothetical protein